MEGEDYDDYLFEYSRLISIQVIHNIHELEFYNQMNAKECSLEKLNKETYEEKSQRL
jgi:hypothetical protein